MNTFLCVKSKKEFVLATDNRYYKSQQMHCGSYCKFKEFNMKTACPKEPIHIEKSQWIFIGCLCMTKSQNEMWKWTGFPFDVPYILNMRPGTKRTHWNARKKRINFHQGYIVLSIQLLSFLYIVFALYSIPSIVLCRSDKSFVRWKHCHWDHGLLCKSYEKASVWFIVR